MSTQNRISIKEVMLPLGKFPVLSEKSIFTEALEEMCNFKLGIACIVNQTGTLEAVITDGDIRRKILNVQKPFSALLSDDLVFHINKKPKKILINSNISKAFNIMKKNKIWDLPVIDKNNKLQGMLHLHPVVKYFLNK